jgi:hypothetical protein
MPITFEGGASSSAASTVSATTLRFAAHVLAP